MNKLIENLILGIAAAAVFAVLPSLTFAQSTETAPLPPKPRPKASPLPESRVEPPAEPARPPRAFRGDTTERSIKVDSGNINLGLGCVNGKIKVNGWNRNEVRVFVEDGNKFAFQILEKNPKSGNPNWINVVGVNPRGRAAGGDCITSDEIEIDAPLNAKITIKGRDLDSIIDSVRQVDVTTIGGDISVRNVSGGVNVSAGRGDISVAGSEGSMSLETTTGNILVFDAAPSESEIGNGFKAKTSSGSIALQRVTHRKIEVNSVSGSLAYNGAILDGGTYSLNTSKGSIRMLIPGTTACTVVASYGYGTFDSAEVPFKLSTENFQEGPVKRVVGTLGKGGDATILKLASVYGSIVIKKQP